MAGYFAMGGYAVYVWGAYAAAAVIMVGMVVTTLLRLRSAQREVDLLERQRPARRRPAKSDGAPLPAEAAASEVSR